MPSDIPSTVDVPPAGGYWTLPNKFGMMRRYLSLPTSIPDQDLRLRDFIEAVVPDTVATPDNELFDESSRPEGSLITGPARPLLERVLDIISPHPNISAFLLNSWFYRRGSMQKSKLDREKLIKDVILNPHFKTSDFAPPFNIGTLDKALVDKELGSDMPDLPGTGWIRSDITIDIPATPSDTRTTWTTPGAYVRDIVQVIRSVLQSPTSRRFNYDGFEEWWKPNGSTTQKPQRVWHNTYTAEAFLRAEAQLRDAEPAGYSDPPQRVVGLMFWSDATHLTSFGQAQLHPVYMGFANQDKNERCRPNQRGLHHIGYIPAVSILYKNALKF
jgi:hypothetical protein